MHNYLVQIHHIHVDNTASISSIIEDTTSIQSMPFKTSMNSYPIITR